MSCLFCKIVLVDLFGGVGYVTDVAKDANHLFCFKLNPAMSYIFCNIIDGSIPSKAVYEDELCYAFADLHPQAPVHVLVAPREHLASLDETDQTDAALLGHLLWAAAEVARNNGLAKGYRL